MEMFSIRKISLALVLILLQSACSKNQTASYLIIDYRQNWQIKEGDFIQIDDYKFTHSSDMEKIAEDYRFLNASNIGVYNPDQDKHYKTRSSSFIVPIQLAERLTYINKNVIKDSVYYYMLHNVEQLLTGGIIVISRSDNKKIEVSFSGNYPAKITRTNELPQ